MWYIPHWKTIFPSHVPCRPVSCSQINGGNIFESPFSLRGASAAAAYGPKSLAESSKPPSTAGVAQLGEARLDARDGDGKGQLILVKNMIWGWNRMDEMLLIFFTYQLGNQHISNWYIWGISSFMMLLGSSRWMWDPLRIHDKARPFENNSPTALQKGIVQYIVNVMIYDQFWMILVFQPCQETPNMLPFSDMI